MKFNSAFFFLLLIFISLQLFTNKNACAAKGVKAERWFEIEVILFKQLNDKAALKEQFPDKLNATKLPKYRHSFDLLNPYLQPNLARIKQFATLCGEQDAQHIFLDSLQKVSTPFPEQMQLIEQVALFNMPDFNAEIYIGETSILENKPEYFNRNDEVSDETALQEAEQIDVVTFEFNSQQAELAKPIFSTQNLCVISQSEIDSLFDKEQLANYNLDSFNVETLPSRLNAAGAHVTDGPYLIADQSLLLKDISQRLRWSREFRPLLHFGWRQVGITKKKAIPLRLFAGKHLSYEYQQALTDYQVEIDEAKAIEQNLSAQSIQNTNQRLNNEADKLTISTNMKTIDNELNVKAKNKQQVLNELFSQSENITSYNIDSVTIQAIVEQIGQESINDTLSTNDDDMNINDQAVVVSNNPIEPIQPWFLEGFFKVHLDRYLYITADFNLFNQNDVKIQNEGNENIDTKLINFSQNRRVITGEIHYFDHPYIGMIVQIRRFDPSKPADEAVTQAIK